MPARARLALAGFFALAPDLDFLPGLLIGPVEAFHNHLSHSILFGLAVCGLAALALHAWRPDLRRLVLWQFTSAAYLSHLAIDYLTWGRGVMLGWPFTEARFSSPVLLFSGVRWRGAVGLGPHLWTLALDALFAALLVFLVEGWMRRRAPSRIRR
jgi:inner membrane protein